MSARKRGRPPVAKKLAKGALLSVRFSESERETLEKAAKRADMRLSEWARAALLLHAKTSHPVPKNQR